MSNSTPAPPPPPPYVRYAVPASGIPYGFFEFHSLTLKRKPSVPWNSSLKRSTVQLNGTILQSRTWSFCSRQNQRLYVSERPIHIHHSPKQ